MLFLYKTNDKFLWKKTPAAKCTVHTVQENLCFEDEDFFFSGACCELLMFMGHCKGISKVIKQLHTEEVEGHF